MECFACSFGYKPFMQTIAVQVKQLDTIVEENLVSSRMHVTSSSRLRTSSTSSTDSRSTVGTLEQQGSMERDVLVDDVSDVTDAAAAGEAKEPLVEDTVCTVS